MSNQSVGLAIKEVPDSVIPTCAELTVHLPQITFRVPANVFTLEGFRAWATSDDSPDKAKVTFLDGKVILDMSGEELQTHGVIKTAICNTVGPLVQELDLGPFFIDGALVTNVPATVSNIPDAVLATWASLEAGRVRLITRRRRNDRYQEIEGTPDWVLEIVSDSSVGKDTRHLREAYHRAGIPEYWLVDARGEEIDFQILLHRPTDYIPAPGRGGWQRSEVFHRRFRLERLPNRLGLWLCTLQAKPLR